MPEEKSCDICLKKNLEEYVDGKTCRGSWANMCIPCYMKMGVGLGLGKGQMYRVSVDGKEWKDVTKHQIERIN